MYRILFPTLVVAFVSVACDCQVADDRSITAGMETDTTVWSFFDFSRPGAIDSFTLEVSERGASHYNRVHRGLRLKKLKVTFGSDDKEVLEALERRIGLDACLVPATVEGYNRAWGGGAHPIGYLTIVIKRKEFKIGITPVGFSHGEGGPKASTLFYSPGAADLLNAIYTANSEIPMPSEITEALSGRKEIARLRERFILKLQTPDAYRKQ